MINYLLLANGIIIFICGIILTAALVWGFWYTSKRINAVCDLMFVYFKNKDMKSTALDGADVDERLIKAGKTGVVNMDEYSEDMLEA